MEVHTRNEQARLAALRRYQVLDTPPEEAFDRLVQMASRILGAPMALMTLLDRERQWAKAKVGMEEREIPRDVSFCHHNLEDADVLVVPDLTADARFATNPYVAGDPGLRFYAGAPLCTPDGFILGSICVLDTAPRTLTADEVATLQDLAALAMEELERRTVHSYRKDLLESITDGFVAVDAKWRFTYVNERAEQMLQRDREDLLGQNLWAVYEPASIPQFHADLQRAVATQQTVHAEVYAEPLQSWIRMHAYPFAEGLSIYFDDITEEREQAALIAQQRNLLEQTQQLAGAWEVELATGSALWTEKLFDIFEYPADHAPSLDEALSFYREPYRTEVAAAVAACRDEGTPFDLELLVETAKGNKRWVRAVGAPVAHAVQPDGSRQVTHMAGALQYITRRKQAEEELRQREHDLREAQRIAQLGSWTWDLVADATTWSNTKFEIFGMTPKPSVAYGELLSRVHPEDREQVEGKEAQLRAPTGSDELDLTYRIVRPDGEVRVLRERSEVVRAADGTALRVVGTAQDITEETRRRRELQEAHRIAEMGTWSHDLQRDEIAWSDQVYRMFGVNTEASVSYADFLARLHPEDRDLLVTFEEGLKAGGAPDEGEITYRFRRPDGEERVAWERAEVERAPDGTARRLVGIVVDRTDEMHQREEVERARDEAEQMNRLKSRFLANMSHEIRTPLTAIIGFSEILKEMDLQGPEAECVDTIYRSSERLFTTLTSVLDLSQLEAGTLALHPAEVVVQDIITDAVSSCDRQAKQRGVTLDCTLPPFDLEATLDRAAFLRILTNLIGNAVKFTPEGRVDVTLIENDDTFTVTVADTGIGIEEDFLPQLFDPFQQESNGDTRLYEGNGLGLAITKDLVDLMNGHITVESEKGTGTTFTLEIPRYAD